MGLLTTKINVRRKIKLLNQLGVTAPIESLHYLIETLKSDRPDMELN